MTLPNSLSSDLSYPSYNMPLVNENVELMPVNNSFYLI